MPITTRLRLALLVAVLCSVFTASAQPPASQAPVTYGDPITIELAKRVAAAARENAEKNHLQMTIAIVDTAGELVYFEKMDGSQTASVKVAIGKARTSALYRRPTKFFEDAVASGGAGLRFLGMPDLLPVDGGFPLIVAGKLVGAIGASGGTNTQDAECGLAGAAALK